MDCGADAGRIPTVTMCEKFYGGCEAQAMDVTLVCGPDLWPGPLIVLTPSLQRYIVMLTEGNRQREEMFRANLS